MYLFDNIIAKHFLGLIVHRVLPSVLYLKLILVFGCNFLIDVDTYDMSGNEDDLFVNWARQYILKIKLFETINKIK